MTDDIMYQLALDTAQQYHKGQVDIAGEPYINHPIAVSNKLEKISHKIVALLHDVIEDTELVPEDLENFGFNQEIISAVVAITKQEKEKYKNYLKRVKDNEIALEVKKADLEHNMDMSRLNEITDKDIRRQDKYKRALEYLNN